MNIAEHNGKKICVSADVAAILRAVLNAESELDIEKEHVWAIGMAADRQIKYIELVHLGTLTSSSAGPREIYRTAVYHACETIIVAHNHPSTNIRPSSGDVEVNSLLKHAGETLGIRLLDHVIMSARTPEYYSFADDGRI